MDIGISRLEGLPPSGLPLEVVERKGIGHPDTICDALAEAFSRALSAYYLERFGQILHHNVDKALLAAGASRPAFGGGALLAPIDIYLAGRAVTEHRGVEVPVTAIAVETTRAWLRANMHAIDAERDVRIHVLVRPVSSDLQSLFDRPGARFANDTSFGTGYAPLDELERVVVAAGQRLDAPETHAAYPEIGEDTKIMAVRRGLDVQLVVACALVGKHLRGVDDYFAAKARIAGLVQQASRKTSALPVAVEVNAADGTTPDSLFLTVTGTSAEAGDDGQVGRGNRVNGLVTPYRTMSVEAVSGKNPVTHVGKLYNLAAHRIAASLVRTLPPIEEAHCHLLSRIGQPVHAPAMVDVRVRLARSQSLSSVRQSIERLVHEEMARV